MTPPGDGYPSASGYCRAANRAVFAGARRYLAMSPIVDSMPRRRGATGRSAVLRRQTAGDVSYSVAAAPSHSHPDAVVVAHTLRIVNTDTSIAPQAHRGKELDHQPEQTCYP